MWRPLQARQSVDFRTTNCTFRLRCNDVLAEIAPYISVFSFVGANIIAYVGWTRIRPQSDHCNAQDLGGLGTAGILRPLAVLSGGTSRRKLSFLGQLIG